MKHFQFTILRKSFLSVILSILFSRKFKKVSNSQLTLIGTASHMNKKNNYLDCFITLETHNWFSTSGLKAANKMTNVFQSFWIEQIWLILISKDIEILTDIFICRHRSFRKKLSILFTRREPFSKFDLKRKWFF